MRRQQEQPAQTDTGNNTSEPKSVRARNKHYHFGTFSPVRRIVGA